MLHQPLAHLRASPGAAEQVACGSQHVAVALHDLQRMHVIQRMSRHGRRGIHRPPVCVSSLSMPFQASKYWSVVHTTLMCDRTAGCKQKNGMPMRTAIIKTALNCILGSARVLTASMVQAELHLQQANCLKAVPMASRVQAELLLQLATRLRLSPEQRQRLRHGAMVAGDRCGERQRRRAPWRVADLRGHQLRHARLAQAAPEQLPAAQQWLSAHPSATVMFPAILPHHTSSKTKFLHLILTGESIPCQDSQ